ncbi:uncharacterized protein [Venturia canescens]|uniref:uncharacterized protein n=1 Tax=Venturia canescens TaxID=32260 RepID=UPI001C9CDCB2|nr:uncharacterized protein LOC122406687 [Venturia canescens]
MTLFRVNNRPMRFHLVDLEDKERAFIEDIIKNLGGVVTDDYKCLVKFTSRKAYGYHRYPRAQIYDVEFIKECMIAQMIVEPHQFRLSAHCPDDDYIMEHFLYGGCSMDRCNTTLRNNDQHRVGMSNNSETTTRPATDCEEDNLTSHATNETMYTALSREDSIPVAENYVDESQAVVLASDLKIYQPILAGGDAAKETLYHEKQPCNVEYELEVKPKMAVLEKERRELALKNNVERTNSTLIEDAENVDPELVSIKEEPIVDLTSSFDSPDTKMSVKLEKSPGDIISASQQLSTISDSDWIETKTNLSKKNVTTKFANAAILAEHMKAKDEIPNYPERSEDVNVCYRGLKGATKPSENARKPSPSQALKRKLVYDEDSLISLKKEASRFLEDEEYIEYSSDSSLIDPLNETRSRRKNSRRQEQDYSQSRKKTSEKGPTRRRFEERESEAGPSGIRNPESDHRHELDDDFNDDDDDDDDDDDAWDAPSECHCNARKELTGSRVRIWRAGLTADMGERDPGVRGSPFNVSEQEIMIKYLLQNGKVRYAKGLIVWKQLIHDGLLPHRTPQSLHNHFTKIILPKIENFKKLTAVELQLFLNLRKEKRRRKQ